MFLDQWDVLTPVERRKLIGKVIRMKRSEANWYEGFELYMQHPESLALVGRFIELAAEYHKTHNHYGAKAIIEQLRWHSFAKDADVLFKINNNYTTDITLLVKYIFPEELDAFFLSRQQRRAA